MTHNIQPSSYVYKLEDVLTKDGCIVNILRIKLYQVHFMAPQLFLEQMPFRKTLFVVARLLLSLKAEHDMNTYHCGMYSDTQCANES